jgi:subtilisin family serine protease
MSGTSMAAPHVAGVIALMVEQATKKATNLTLSDVRRRLRQGADAADTAPIDSPAGGYSYDGEREGVLSAPGTLNLD